MRRSMLLLTGVAAASVVAASAAAAEPRPAAAPKAATLASRFLAVSNVVLEQHVDPPTRQQMLLEGMKALYRAAGKSVPQNLSRRISKLAGDAEMTAFLNGVGSRIRGNPERVNAAFVAGVLQALPGNARLIPASSLKVEDQLNANRYVGTGIVLRRNDQAGRPSIPKAFYNGPAWKAGVKAGDLILEIDGKSTEKMSLGDVVTMLRGPAGSVVAMKVRQPEAGETRTLKITRAVTFIPTVVGHRQISAGKWRFLVESNRELGYVRINRIGSSTLHELRQVARKLSQKKLRGVVLDLRYGGTTLHDAVLIADALIDGGTIGRVRSAGKVKVHNSSPGALFGNLPLAVLIDRGAGGGREFLAAALQDARGAAIVGEPTVGDGFVRKYVQVPGWDQAVLLAVGELERGDGTPLRAGRRAAVVPVKAKKAKAKSHRPPRRRPGGLVPDHLVTLTSAKRAELMRAYSFTAKGLRKPVPDPLLSKAVEVLNAKSNQVRAGSKREKASG